MYWTIQFNTFRLLLLYLCRKSERSLFIPDIKHTSVRHFDAGIGNEPFSIRVVSAVGRVICDDKSMLGGMIAKTDVFSADISSVHHDLTQLTASSEKNIGVSREGKTLVCQRAGHIRSSSGAAICCNGFPCCQNPLSSRKAVDPPKTGRHRTASSISSSTSAAAL